MAECTHENLDANVRIDRIVNSDTQAKPVFHAIVRLTCLGCGIPFTFHPDDANISFDGTLMTIKVGPQGKKVAVREGNVGITPRTPTAKAAASN
jgi:hypothetical protein